jgi:hypothetical protein
VAPSSGIPLAAASEAPPVEMGLGPEDAVLLGRLTSLTTLMDVAVNHLGVEVTPAVHSQGLLA